ncbi:MAG TPA: DUF1365 domain-containing protein [Gammaproteobacteria bacterium]|nr:DUF1365 domain-containing protein [Gammaproteobacteria bacterium]
MNASCLYFGAVMHQRMRELGYRFVYKVFSLYLDLDELPALHRRLRLFSHNRFNLVSFHDRDHGPRDGAALRSWLEELLRARGIELEGGKVYLLCFPRVLGYGFNPMSLWYCHHADGSLRAIVCEVRNTFGGMHHYVLADGGSPMEWRGERRARKVFHVSPFMPAEAEYRFRFREPAQRLSVYISEYEMHGRIEREPAQAGSAEASPGVYRTGRVVKAQEGLSQGNGATPLAERPLLEASIAGKRLPLTDARLISMFARLPFMTLKVMAMIHWQALKIWRRGGRFHRMPEGGLYQGSERVTQGWSVHGR